jgi:hypothetical protein
VPTRTDATENREPTSRPICSIPAGDISASGVEQRRTVLPAVVRSIPVVAAAGGSKKTSSFNLTGTGSQPLFTTCLAKLNVESYSLESSRIPLVYYEAVWELGRLSRGSSSSSATELSQMSPLK